MKIIYFSDLHGKFAALPSLPPADLYLFGGDFTNGGDEAEVRDAIAQFEAVLPHFLALGGNMDTRATEKLLAERHHLLPSTQPAVVQGLTLFGLAGSHICPVPTPCDWDDQQMATRLQDIPTQPLDLLVTHAPPHGFGADVIPNGMHVGSHAVADFARRMKPRLHLCGHIHEAAGIYAAEGTLLVNAGAFGEEGHHAVIEWEEAQAPAVWLATAR